MKKFIKTLNVSFYVFIGVLGFSLMMGASATMPYALHIPFGVAIIVLAVLQIRNIYKPL